MTLEQYMITFYISYLARCVVTRPSMTRPSSLSPLYIHMYEPIQGYVYLSDRRLEARTTLYKIKLAHLVRLGTPDAESLKHVNSK